MPQRTARLLRTARNRARTPGTTAVLAGSLASGLGAYLFQVLGTRSLGDEGYAAIGVLWTIQYLVFTIALLSVEAYVTRAVTLHGDDGKVLRHSLRGLAAWIAGVALLLSAASWVLRDALFSGQAGGWFALIAGLIVIAFGVHVVIRGWLAGSYRFGQYGIATGIESMGRVAAALPITLVAPSTLAIACTLPLGPALVVLWWWAAVRGRPYTGPQRPSAAVSAPVAEHCSTRRYLAATTVANAASQTLLAAGPLVLLLLGADAAETSVFFVTITAARAPLVFAIGGVLSRVLPPLTRAARAGRYHRLRRIAVLTAASAAALAAVGAAAASWIGPQVIAVLFGADFRPDGWFVALAAAGVIGATAALGLNQILIAMGAETRLVVPWLSALLVGAGTVAVLNGSPTLQVASGFVTGEAAALLGLLAAIITIRPASSTAPASPQPLPSAAVPAPTVPNE